MHMIYLYAYVCVYIYTHTHSFHKKNCTDGREPTAIGRVPIAIGRFWAATWFASVRDNAREPAFERARLLLRPGPAARRRATRRAPSRGGAPRRPPTPTS